MHRSAAASEGDIRAAVEGLRELKKRRTRRSLQEAALALFQERGMDAVTVDEIAALVEVSPRTFYRYFPTKEDVLFEVAREYLDVLVEAIRSRPEDEGPLDALRNAYIVMAESGEHDDLAQVWLAVVRRTRSAMYAMEQSIEDAIVEALLAREPDVDPLRCRAGVAAFQAVVRVNMSAPVDPARGSLNRRLAELLSTMRSDFLDLTASPPKAPATSTRSATTRARKSSRKR